MILKMVFKKYFNTRPFSILFFNITISLFSLFGLLKNMMPSSSFTSVTVIPDIFIYTPIEWSYDTLNDTQRRKTAKQRLPLQTLTQLAA